MFSCIVPIKNQYVPVKQCLDSIVRYYTSQEIIMIDDASNESRVIDLLKEYSLKYGWALIRNEISVGHSQACTQGINVAKNDIVFLLNSDIILSSKCLYLLAEVLENNKDIGCVGPYTSSATGEQLIKEYYSKRFSMSIKDIENVAESLENNRELQDIALTNGFCVGMRKSLFNELNGFDTRLTCYGNEKELQIRMRKAGYRTCLAKNTFCLHLGKMSYSHENINVGQACKDADNLILKLHGKLE
jgi:GT2 family glycosyltransferase